MAKRKRLTPPQPGTLPPAARAALAPSLGRVPIAQVAGDAALTAAFETVQGELQAAQREGRMVLALPLSAIRADYLIRDRLACDPDEMEMLKQSLRQRGQQTPIEVTDLGQGSYGLISGWRRLRALSELHAESGGMERFGTIQALLRLPADRPAAYIAMIEENEIRADLSFYERARIVVQAVQAGVFDSDKQALQSLFSTASFSKRSKVKSFMPLVQGLDEVLRYPAQISERLGLALSRRLGEKPGAKAALKQALRRANVSSGEEERAILEEYLNGPRAAKSPVKPAVKPAKGAPRGGADGVSLSFKRGRIVLEGANVTAAMAKELQAWLKARQD